MYDQVPEAVAKRKEFNPDNAKVLDSVPCWMVVTVRTKHLDNDGGISAKCTLEDHAAVVSATLNFV